MPSSWIPALHATVRPDSTLAGFLARASRRVAWTTAALGAAGGWTVALVISLAGWPGRGAPLASIAAGVALATIGAATALMIAADRRRHVAALVERRAPICRNLVITAAELPTRHDVAEPVALLINQRAAALVRTLDLAALFPARDALLAVAGAGFVWALTVARAAAAPAAAPATARGTGSATTASVDAVEITVTPPGYTHLPPRTVRDPARVEAFIGSRIRVVARSGASTISMETLHARALMTSAASGAFTSELLADADGYVALEPLAADGRPGARRLVGLSVISDDAPRVRITAPARDLVLRDGHETIELTVDASDDLALASLRVRYTRVSGLGERFTFSEGDVPIQVTRKDAKAWTARAAWRLDGLALGPGDMVVYRAVAADHRPGATPSESDAFIAELPTVGGQAAPGFAVDPEQERYAVSQQMVILKTERLAARRPAMSTDAYVAEAQDIAGEQRKVRAEFVFMMGGELADALDENADMTAINEEQEAAGEDDLLAGRAANQGHIALLRAIRAMSRAAGALTSAELPTALTHERAALKQLERAFSRSRILLRALSERERLDFTRRLTGSLSDAARSAQPRVEAEPTSRVIDLRRALAGVATLAGTPRLDGDAPARASRIAEDVLRVAPGDTSLHAVATLLSSAADALARSRVAEARALLDSAAIALAAALRADLLDAPEAGGPNAFELDRLAGALDDGRRRGRGGSR